MYGATWYECAMYGTFIQGWIGSSRPWRGALRTARRVNTTASATENIHASSNTNCLRLCAENIGFLPHLSGAILIFLSGMLMVSHHDQGAAALLDLIRHSGYIGKLGFPPKHMRLNQHAPWRSALRIS